jgi:selenide,water dikinase
VAGAVEAHRAAALHDPQTSGGLLFAAPVGLAGEIEEAFRAAGQPLWRVGQFVDGHGVAVR